MRVRTKKFMMLLVMMIAGYLSFSSHTIVVKAAQSGTFEDRDGDGNVISWSYDDGSKTLTFSGTGEWGLLGAEPFASMEIQKIQFQNCKVIGSMEFAFWRARNEDGRYMVDSLEVTEIDFSGLDTSSVTNMSTMLWCPNLTSLDVSGLDTSNVTTMANMFYYCEGLTSLDVSGLETSNVTGMGGMFYNCLNLTSLDVSGFDTSNVTDMQSMFAGCTGLTSLDVSGLETSNVTSMAFMFDDCAGLTSLNVSGFDTSKVTNMQGMFAGCTGLTSLDVSGFDTSNVTDMHSMFSDCVGLTSLDVSGFDTSNVTDMHSMFSGCTGLTSLDVSGFDTNWVLDINSMFAKCDNLTTLDLSNFNLRIMSNKTAKNIVDGNLLRVLKTPKAISEYLKIDLHQTFYDADVYDSTGEYLTTTVLNASFAGKTLKRYDANTDHDSDTPTVQPDEGGNGGEDTDTDDSGNTEQPDDTNEEEDAGNTGDDSGNTEQPDDTDEEEDAGNIGDDSSNVEQPDDSDEEDSDMTVLEERITQADSGEVVRIDREENINALSNDMMKQLAKRGDVTLVLECSYEGVNYTVTIPAGKAEVNDIPWYGPLYLAARYGGSASVSGTGHSVYVVKAGDTLSRIALRNGISLSQLVAWNPQIKNADIITVGQEINLK